MGCFFNRISARFLFKKEEEAALVFDSEEESKEDDDTSRKSWMRYDRRRPNFLLITGDLIVSLSDDGDPDDDIGPVGVEGLESPESEESVLLWTSNRTDLLLRKDFEMLVFDVSIVLNLNLPVLLHLQSLFSFFVKNFCIFIFFPIVLS